MAGVDIGSLDLNVEPMEGVSLFIPPPEVFSTLSREQQLASYGQVFRSYNDVTKIRDGLLAELEKFKKSHRAHRLAREKAEAELVKLRSEKHAPNVAELEAKLAAALRDKDEFAARLSKEFDEGMAKAAEAMTEKEKADAEKEKATAETRRLNMRLEKLTTLPLSDLLKRSMVVDSAEYGQMKLKLDGQYSTKSFAEKNERYNNAKDKLQKLQREVDERRPKIIKAQMRVAILKGYVRTANAALTEQEEKEHQIALIKEKKRRADAEFAKEIEDIKGGKASAVSTLTYKRTKRGSKYIDDEAEEVSAEDSDDARELDKALGNA